LFQNNKLWKISFNEKKGRKLILHNFVEKLGFSLSMRAKKWKIGKFNIYFVHSTFCISWLIRKKDRKWKKAHFRKPKISNEHYLAWQWNSSPRLRDLAKKLTLLDQRYGNFKRSWTLDPTKFRKYQIDDVYNTIVQEK
jgi:hypothetical protein